MVFSVPLRSLHTISLCPKQFFFNICEIRSFIKSLFKSFPELPAPSVMDSLLDLKPEGRGLISRIYSLISTIGPHSTDFVKNSWQLDLGRDFSKNLSAENDTFIDYIVSPPGGDK